MDDKEDAPLTAAAAILEDELKRYAEISAEALRAPLTSEKGLTRARKMLVDAHACQQRLGAHLQALVVAMNHAGDQQKNCMETTLAAAKQIETRSAEFATLMNRFAEVGRRASAVNEPVGMVAVRKAQGAPAEELVAGLRQVLELIDGVIDEADSLAKDAAEGSWGDVAREADALKQQVQSARNRLLLAERKLGAGKDSVS